MALSCLVDWRGVPDLTKQADLYSIGPFPSARPALGNPRGRVLVAVSSTVLMAPNGMPAGGIYNQRFHAMALRLGALTGREVWRNEAGYYSVLVDITRRGFVAAWGALLLDAFPWADGFHIDWFTAWSWRFPDMAPMDAAWDRCLAGIASLLRGTGKLVLGQQFHLTEPVMACNGPFVERSPYSFGQTLASHAAALDLFSNAIERMDPRREIVWVFEIQDPTRWPKEELDRVKAWATAQGVYVSLGRDAASVGA